MFRYFKKISSITLRNVHKWRCIFHIYWLGTLQRNKTFAHFRKVATNFQGLRSSRLGIDMSDVWSLQKKELTDFSPPFWLAWQGLWQDTKCQTLSEEPPDSFLLRQQFLNKSFAFCALLWFVSFCWSTTATSDTLLIPCWGNHVSQIPNVDGSRWLQSHKTEACGHPVVLKCN